MDAPIRVMVVDDSGVVRRFLVKLLGQDPEIEVVGAASNGKIALQRLDSWQVDVVTMDVEMPEMSGIEALRLIQQRRPGLPVIMVSSLTRRGAEATFEALSLGAKGYVTKPSMTSGPAEAMELLRSQLVPLVKELGRASRSRGKRREEQALHLRRSMSKLTAVHLRLTGQQLVPPAAPPPRRPLPTSKPNVLAIGVSTGGPEALAKLLGALPSELGLPLLITQHMPPMFTASLAKRLSERTSWNVREAVEGELLQPNVGLVAPGGWHMEVRRDGSQVRVRLHQGPKENSCRPSVDVMLRSVAQVYGDRALAVILTGMGEDGAASCGLIREAGGSVLSQDQESCVVYGMPRAVESRGLADGVHPLGEMADAIVRRVRPSGGARLRALRASRRGGAEAARSRSLPGSSRS